ncbi:hypothetical protein C6P46_004293 [Rhodotorula mucilaginosa]|uniref:TAFII55 protein conserved region domain-containing protein n=1 Tax=Rhodotorula mucilaginosa TaxID=5537 RepID=A0A9P6W979_RHOMI|nr:hypothetical protein C6P46_004293 [Rhodotorula mucilaginosa]TKA54957.1 hypothetical protein B0A53_02430 [Rhodotorula sp. CCFEE 5036]
MDPVASTSSGPALTIAAGRPRRQRRTRVTADGSDDDYGGGGSGHRLRVRMGHGQGGGAGGGGAGGHGQQQMNPADSVGWDRELDSDPDEPLAVEEHFILRVPPEIAPKLREQVDKRDVSSDVWFKFKDSRRAVFHLDNKLYGAKLVDLPALIESQRLTGVGGQTVKVADVSQMLLVEEQIRDEPDVTRDKVFNIEDFVYPHGITPPLKHVRKRRFRRRINRRTIEQVETAVEKLLEADARAEKVQFEMLDYDVPSDDEDYDPAQRRGGETDSLGAPTPRTGVDTGVSSPAPFGDDYSVGAGGSQRGDGDEDGREDDDDDDSSDEAGSGYDSDLAKEIEKDLNMANKGQGGTDESGSDDDDGDGLFGGSSDDDDDDDDDDDAAGLDAGMGGTGTSGVPDDAETVEARKRLKLLAEEMGDLDRAIAAKEVELAKAPNPIFKKRFEELIKKLTSERDSKKAQHASISHDIEKRREDAAAAALAEAADPPSMADVVQPVAGSSATATPAAAGSGTDAMDLA